MHEWLHCRGNPDLKGVLQLGLGAVKLDMDGLANHKLISWPNRLAMTLYTGQASVKSAQPALPP